ncbi:hypothetical protein HIM_07027 [Hirsutella minnesotensis 3608]|uniref:Major facilitator superfamily (MFS) profile domain-containing protein n=1 Tax=Hirsutella minnesotensis 3608 TaxID=1043627 RepID=A0A0F7ZI69_9HYPO|nr:hypothetical protein HIM_07027 [Hirsutella minnesotensis 3608]
MSHQQIGPSESRVAEDIAPTNTDVIKTVTELNEDHPLNWRASKRWLHVTLAAVLGLIANMAATMCAPGIGGLVAEFGIESSKILGTLAVTIYVLGIALGPLVMSPLSETWGRLLIYHASNIIFVAFLIGSALSRNIAQYMVFRFLSGCAGGAPMALGGGTIADVTHLKERASAMALFSLGPLTGPVLGPLIGGFVATSRGWRWTFWVLVILSSAVTMFTFAVMRETHPRVLHERKSRSLRVSEGSVASEYVSQLQRHLSARHLLLQALTRPFELLIQSPVLLAISLYVAFIFGLLYILFTSFSPVFEGQYGFSTATSGLVYLGLGISLVIDVFIFGPLNHRVQAVCEKRDGGHVPEHRLLLMIWFSPFVPAGLLLYGWTVEYKVHWVVPILGTVLIGFGGFFIVMPAQLYIVDLFGSGASASALSASLLVRYVCGTFLPLATPKLYATLRYGWGNTLLALLALVFVPAPIIIYHFGKRVRQRNMSKA